MPIQHPAHDEPWTPNALAKLARLSRHCPARPKIRGTAHTATCAAVDHARVPTVFTFDCHAFRELEIVLYDLLSSPDSQSAAFVSRLAAAMAENKTTLRLSVDGERGRESPFAEPMLSVMLDDMSGRRKWFSVASAGDLALKSPPDWTCLGVEVRCGYNLLPHGRIERIVLSGS